MTMAPIKNYFGEERMARVHQKNAEAIGRINENNRQRMLDAIESYENKKKKPRSRKRRYLDKDTIKTIVDLYVAGKNLSTISALVGASEEDVFFYLQNPLLKYIDGSRGQYLYHPAEKRKIYPKVDAILAELDELGEHPDIFVLNIMTRTNCSKLYAERLVGVKTGFVFMPVAEDVCHYFGICADKLFYSDKEKAAE